MNEPTRNDDDIVDEAVRRAYRDSAVETVPDSLNRRVLAEAGYAVSLKRGRRWPAFRPLAWAATVGLSLAIVLKITTVGPDPEAIPEATPEGPRYEISEPLAETEALPDAADDDTAATLSPAEKRERLRSRSGMSAAPTASRPAAVTDDVPAASVAEAETATDTVERQSASVHSASGAAVADDTLSFCGEDERRDPERWRQCILDLVDAKHRDRARIEYRRYREAFPDAPPIDL